MGDDAEHQIPGFCSPGAIPDRRTWLRLHLKSDTIALTDTRIRECQFDRESKVAEPSALAAKLLEGIAKEFGSKALTAVFGGLSKFRDALRMNFSEYIDSAIDRASHVKTLLHRDNRVSLFSIYVETFLRSGSKVIRDDKLINAIRRAASVLVIGSAGTGKTMFIRYVFMQLVEGQVREG
jgi:hypothetical protein